MKFKYVALRAPFPLDFKQMSKQQANTYLAWFQEQIPERIVVLSHFVKSFPKYRSWEADLNPASLDDLGSWFCGIVKTRTRTATEMGIIYSKDPRLFSVIGVPDEELTIETVSIAVDVSMYISQLLVTNIPSLYWKLGKKPKSSMFYQHPVLIGPSNDEFDPVHVITTYAYGIAQGVNGPSRLREIYEIRAKILTEGYHAEDFRTHL